MTKRLATLAFLFVLASLPSYSQAANTPPTKPNDPLQDITIYGHPEDFATAQQLALQNRAERIEKIEEVIECIQSAKSIEDINVCQKKEKTDLAKVRLAYCGTGVARLALDGNADFPTAHKTTECEDDVSFLKPRQVMQGAEGQGMSH